MRSNIPTAKVQSDQWGLVVSGLAAGGMVRPDVNEDDAVQIARECYGIQAIATELGSNQDRNFLLTTPDGQQSVLRVDNELFTDAAREGQHAAIRAYETAGVSVASVLPGADGNLTQHWRGHAVRRSVFAEGTPLIDHGYLAPCILAEFGELAAASVTALATLTHPGFDRVNMWDMRVAHRETLLLAPAIDDDELRVRVINAAETAAAQLAPHAAELPVQVIHGDLTDDNVMGLLGKDGRVHPHTLLDLGDLGYGWRVAELAVTVSSMLHHEPAQPLRVRETISAFHQYAPLSLAEARSLWPLVVLRAALLIASGWRQLQIDGDNEYARERIAAEQTIFDAATSLSLLEGTESVLACLGFAAAAVHIRPSDSLPQLGSLVEGCVAAPVLVDFSVCSPHLNEGEWITKQEGSDLPPSVQPGSAPQQGYRMRNSPADYADTCVDVTGAELELIQELLLQESLSQEANERQPAQLQATPPQQHAAAARAMAYVPYGRFRLTRTQIDAVDPAATWPLHTEIWLPSGTPQLVVSPVGGVIEQVAAGSVTIRFTETWCLRISGLAPQSDVAGRGGVRAESGACNDKNVAHQLHVGETVAVGDPLGASYSVAADAPHRLLVGVFRVDALQALDDLQKCASLGGLGETQALKKSELTESEPMQYELIQQVFIQPDLVPAWQRLSADPAPLLGVPSHAQNDESETTQQRRAQIFASAQEQYYERPMQIERGWQHHLVDTTGRAYVDLVNNVSGIGHAHPAVADALNTQSRLLYTNSRFLYQGLAEYSERLLKLLPAESELDTVLLVNSGSEAVDLSLRLAQAATGRSTVVALREAYHGWTMASDAITTSAYDNPNALGSRPEWVHVADVPNRFRGTYRGDATDLTVGQRYAADLNDDLRQLDAAGTPVAAFICESVLGNAGGVLLPEGYLAQAYQSVHAAGGLCIADEVQVGFGRMGSSFWGFEQSGVLPDIITIAKPMGNGYPIGGVITSKRVADALATQGQFFASTGGNPLSCSVGIAVLDAMQADHLQQNALAVGTYLLAGFKRLARKHTIIGPIHGEGLYLGVELVRDHTTMQPATAETEAICERMRELGVVVLATSERSNVLKVKPPLCLTVQSAEHVLNQLDRVLSEGW